jgi:hypothetical protein
MNINIKTDEKKVHPLFRKEEEKKKKNKKPKKNQNTMLKPRNN